MNKLKITRTRSGICCIENQKSTLKHLGLNKIRSSVVVEDTPMIRGMIRKVEHMVKVEPLKD
ncbi:MAG: 50S ribosomal protein L30 [Bradymonadales bacterium]|jgi:large subunit ribosomal protein L30